MIKRSFLSGLLLWFGSAAGLQAVPTSPATPPDLDQVRQLIRTHLPGVTEAELQQYACDGLLHGLRGKVQLRDPQTAAATNSLVTQHAVIDASVIYLRVHTVAVGLTDAVATLCEALAVTNQIKGVVLDLRFASGDDYAAAATAVNLFVSDDRELLDWGSGMIKSTAKTNAIAGPVVVLVNNETTGAPEAVAALLRETGAGLLLGASTRGAAMTAREFPLANGQILRIATTPVKLGGGKLIPPSGVVPDIQVAVTAADESIYFNDPYAVINKFAALTNRLGSVTNQVPRRTRTTEADLVRARREGTSLDGELPPLRDAEPEPPVIRDPVLARAVDLLKGLAVVRRPR